MQNLADRAQTINIACTGAAAEFLCGARPADATFSGNTLTVALDGHTTALVRMLPQITPGLYNGNIKYGYLCSGPAEAKGFTAPFVALYAIRKDGAEELLALSGSSLRLPEMDGVGYEVRIFSWDGKMQPSQKVYRLQSNI